MRCAINLEKSLFLLALLSSSIGLASAVNCTPTDDDGSPLTGSGVDGTFATCTYQNAGLCTYFPVDGSFSSGSSTCPPGLPQGAGGSIDTSTSTTSLVTPTSTTSDVVITPTFTVTSTTETPVITTSSTTTTDVTSTDVTSTTPLSSPSSSGFLTSASPTITTVTTSPVVTPGSSAVGSFQRGSVVAFLAMGFTAVLAGSMGIL